MVDVRDERLECPHCGHHFLSVRGFKKTVASGIEDPVVIWIETCPSCKVRGEHDYNYRYQNQRGVVNPSLPKPSKQIFEGVFIADRLKDYKTVPPDLKEALAEEQRLRALAKEEADGRSEEDPEEGS